jgi:hypothetical protein
MHEGHTNSAIANFQFVVDRRDYTACVSEEVLPGVRMIRDSDNDEMFLMAPVDTYLATVKTTRAVLSRQIHAVVLQ